MHIQDFSAAEFGSLPLPEHISIEDDPGFGLELDLRPCVSLEPGESPCAFYTVSLKLSTCKLARRNASMLTCKHDGANQA